MIAAEPWPPGARARARWRSSAACRRAWRCGAAVMARTACRRARQPAAGRGMLAAGRCLRP